MTSLIANIVKASAVCTVVEGDALARLRELPAESVNCCVTSPPYWGLRDYAIAGVIGREESPELYILALEEVFREVLRVLHKDGTCWLNLGDTYWTGPDRRKGIANDWTAGTPFKPKDLVGLPWRVALALQSSGWWLRSDIVWHKPNPMPESVKDRPTSCHEYIFLLTKSKSYYYDADSITEPITCPERYGHRYDGKPYNEQTSDPKGGGFRGKGGIKKRIEGPVPQSRNKRDVWTVPTHGYTDAHFATFPPNLIRPCVLAGCPVGGTVLDPFAGSGTTGQVALEEGRNALLIELNPDYIALIRKRCHL